MNHGVILPPGQAYGKWYFRGMQIPHNRYHWIVIRCVGDDDSYSRGKKEKDGAMQLANGIKNEKKP
jgi:hypothetical protein